VIVNSLQLETIKVGKGRKAKKETVLLLNFSGALNAKAAGNPNAYQIAPLMKVKGKGKRPGTKIGQSVPPASAVYNASNHSVTLTPRGKLNLAKPEELTIDAALVTDALGRPLDGKDDGQPGGNYVVTFSRSGVSTGAVISGRTSEQPATVQAAIDALLARGELDEFKRSVRPDQPRRVSDECANARCCRALTCVRFGCDLGPDADPNHRRPHDQVGHQPLGRGANPGSVSYRNSS
jgi:hypothetical protein